MPGKIKIVVAMTLLVLIAYGSFRLFKVAPDNAERLALGTLERDRVTLSATANEIITSQPIKEGSEVKAGDILVKLDTTLQEAAVAKVEAEIAQLEAVLLKLRNGSRSEEIRSATARVDSAKSLLLESERELRRITLLANQQMVARVQADTLESQRDSNAARLRDAEAQLALVRAGARTEDITQVESQLSAAQALLAAEKKKLSNLTVTATIDGTLDSLPWNVGERVSPGAQLAILLAEGAPYVRAYIPETSRATITPGQQVTVHVDGVNDALQGTVRWIAHEPAFTPYYALNSSERSRLVYLAEIQLSDRTDNLPAGLPAQVELP